MKYSLSCFIDCRIILDNEVKIEKNNFTYIFSPNLKNILETITIISPLIQNHKPQQVMVNSDSDIKANFCISIDSILYENMIQDFILLEAILAYFGDITKIKWDNPKTDFIFDNIEEKNASSIYGFSQSTFYDLPSYRFDETPLKSLIESKDKYKDIVIPLTFFREGKNEHREQKYVNAYYNFFYILEGLYGHGKSKVDALKKEFKNNHELTAIIKNELVHFEQNHKEHLCGIKKVLGKNETPNFSVDDAINMIIKLRGELHHFFYPHNKRMKWNPLNQKEFQSASFFLLCICTSVMVTLIKLRISNVQVTSNNNQL